MKELLSISTLGELKVTYKDTNLLDEISSRKAVALLVYLACTGKPHTRNQLGELFWTDRNKEQALSNLRTLLSRLRPNLQSYLLITRDTIAFDFSQPYQLDVFELREALKAARAFYSRQRRLSGELATLLEKTLPLYQGEFLLGWQLADSLDFEEWASQEREELHNRVTEAIERLTEYHELKGNVEAQSHWVGQLLELDPLREEAHRQRMLFLTRNGQRQAALNHYKSYQLYLTQELDIAPEAETIDLFERIRAGKLEDIKPPQTHNLIPANTTRLDQLKRVGLFSETPDHLLEEVAALLEEVSFKPTDIIFEKGEPGNCMYIIIEGQIRIFDGLRVINDLAERDIFGEMALLDSAPRLASAKALSATKLWRLEQEAFYRLLAERFEIVRAVIELLSKRLRERISDLVELNQRITTISQTPPYH